MAIDPLRSALELAEGFGLLQARLGLAVEGFGDAEQALAEIQKQQQQLKQQAQGSNIGAVDIERLYQQTGRECRDPVATDGKPSPMRP